MRSVPHRVVCLLGLDDGAFPRKAPRDGDDLMLADPHVGDRDSRTEDRQLLLDALMAAQRPADHHLHGQRRAHEHRRARRRCRSASCWTSSAATSCVQHPLQPFDPRNFTRRAPLELRPRDARGRAVARRRRAPAAAVPARAAAARASPARSSSTTSCASSSIRCARSCASGSGSASATTRDEVGDALPVELDALERWGVGERLLDALMAGTDGRAAIRAEIAAGKLPPGPARAAGRAARSGRAWTRSPSGRGR